MSDRRRLTRRPFSAAAAAFSAIVLLALSLFSPEEAEAASTRSAAVDAFLAPTRPFRVTATATATA
eukprot:CAMPEP_0183322440 /NCGR_PEP_ID=MMETSP0160_2-20130417/71645_1 /TAXON_ID=2839 ORGANISM="Odontella Sinensis, Strain Grunow 1884" /NCGR_SAMPLE_ID=MMETSP0160_2 /ASSEMBLY_ACC=CAM_ASM_000250 /LENGTH=65 /DNA_ID=CAMNT_0025489607 /DNA_START=40 /DNA_END=233 /DNA_ORIENTATION=+